MSESELPSSDDTANEPVESTAATSAKKAVQPSVPVKVVDGALPEKPVKLKREKHAAASDASGASSVPATSNKKLKTEVKDESRKTTSAQSASNFFASLPGSQNSTASALSAYPSSYIQSLQGLGFSAYPALFADPSQNNPFLPSVAFGLAQNSPENLKNQEAFLKSLSATAACSASANAAVSNGVHGSGAATVSSQSASRSGGAPSSGKTNSCSTASANGHEKEKESGSRDQLLAASSVAQILAVVKGSLSSAEMASLKQLVAGYREAAALLLKSADELENVLESAGCKI